MKAQAIAIADCIHHWLLPIPNGPTCIGVCKLCQGQRTFSNVPSFMQERTDYKMPPVISEEARAEYVAATKGHYMGWERNTVRRIASVRKGGATTATQRRKRYPHSRYDPPTNVWKEEKNNGTEDNR